ncbi:hypothetical protein B566_EDAN006801 [Ephemera danica]|nr:hypothetical protein B566_EDAN006801 [Ephemera danica]
MTEDSGFQISELLLLSLDHVFVNVRPSAGGRELQLCVADARLDNQMIYGEGVDFPVVLMRQEPLTPFRINLNDFKDAADGIEPVALLYISLTQEFGADMQAAVSMLRVSMCPISVYVEDALVARCSRLLEQLSPSRLILMPPAPASSATGQLPRQIQQLVIEPLSVLVSLRTSRRVFIALDRSPLHFSRFERSRVCTTNYRLGHELTRHYLSGALFRAGWVVGSLELLGSPSAFALTVGSGLRDFVCLPYLGFLQGPWGFLTGITHGSASLMKHLTAGTVSSITNMASSVARNLERCSLDREHVERAEEARRQRPQGVSQGVLQGLSSLGISLLEDLGFPLMCIDGKFDRNGQDCVLVLTPRQLFILVPKDQSATQMFPLDSLRAIPVVGSNSKLCFTFKPSLLLPEPQDTPHWRVEDFVRHVGVPHPLEPTVPDEPEGCVGAQSHLPCLHVLIKPALRQYVLNILQMARREALQRGFNALL